MSEYTTDDLVTRVKEESFYPPGVEDSAIVNRLTRELQNNVFPLIRETNEDYLVRYKDYTNASGGLLLSSRMAGGLVREVKTYTGSVSQSTNLNDIGRANLDEIQRMVYPSFYIQGNRLFTLPDSTHTGKVRVYYFHRPSELVLKSSCALITAIDTTAKTVTVSSVPSSIDSTKTIDFVQALPPFEPLSIDVAISSLVSTTFTFASLPSELVVGDYICLKETSPVPQIPSECFDLLVYGAALRLVRSAKDPQGVQVLMQAVADERQKVKGFLQPRADGAPQMVTGSGLLGYRP